MSHQIKEWTTRQNITQHIFFIESKKVHFSLTMSNLMIYDPFAQLISQIGYNLVTGSGNQNKVSY